MLSTDRRHTTTTDGSLPVWLAALLAVECQATAGGVARKVAWHCRSGRAVYTNLGPETEIIHPFGIPLGRGETLIVSWLPGDTGYTIQLEPDCLAA